MSVAWEEWFEDIWDALVSLTKDVTEFGDRVYYGKKQDVDEFPSAYVTPTRAASTPYTMNEDLWNPIFDIYIVVENPDSKVGTLTAWKLGGKLIDILHANRTLGNLLHTLQCSEIVDSPSGMGGMEQHWVAVTVSCQRKL